jgi:hypothetical protein
MYYYIKIQTGPRVRRQIMMFNEIPRQIRQYITTFLFPYPVPRTQLLRSLRRSYNKLGYLRLVDHAMNNMLSYVDLDASLARAFNIPDVVSIGGIGERWIHHIRSGVSRFADLFEEFTRIQDCVDDFMRHMLVKVPGEVLQFVALPVLACDALRRAYSSLARGMDPLHGPRLENFFDIMTFVYVASIDACEDGCVYSSQVSLRGEMFVLRYLPPDMYNIVFLNYAHRSTRVSGRYFAATDARCLTPKLFYTDNLLWCLLDKFQTAARLRVAVDSVGVQMQTRLENALQYTSNTEHTLELKVQRAFRSRDMRLPVSMIRTLGFADIVPPIYNVMQHLYYDNTGSHWTGPLLRLCAPALAARIVFQRPHLPVPSAYVAFFECYFSRNRIGRRPRACTMADIFSRLTSWPGYDTIQTFHLSQQSGTYAPFSVYDNNTGRYIESETSGYYSSIM